MALYRLNYKNKDLSDGVLEKANRQDIDYERDFENWLENSPHVLFENNETSTIMWMGRQVLAVYDDRYKFPDLMGIDSDGNIIIVELKKGKTPREVVAQILEYAAWAEKLTYDQLNNITIVKEVHLYDSDVTSYTDLVKAMNVKDDGRRIGFITQRYEMENYIPRKLIEEEFNLDLSTYEATWANEDIPKLLVGKVKGKMGKDAEDKEKISKGILNGRVSKKITKEMLDEMGTFEEIEMWFKKVKELMK